MHFNQLRMSMFKDEDGNHLNFANVYIAVVILRSAVVVVWLDTTMTKTSHIPILLLDNPGSSFLLSQCRQRLLPLLHFLWHHICDTNTKQTRESN